MVFIPVVFFTKTMRPADSIMEHARRVFVARQKIRIPSSLHNSQDSLHVSVEQTAAVESYI